MGQKKLIVIDMQNDFVGGSLRNDEAKKIIPTIRKLIEDFHKTGNQVIFTKDTHYDASYLNSPEGIKLPVKHCIEGTEGWEIVDELKEVMKTEDTVITKPAFGFQGWFEYIDPDDIVFMVGTCTDICVISNALLIKAIVPSALINIVRPACAGLTKEKHDAAIEVMKSCQCDIVDEVIFPELRG